MVKFLFDFGIVGLKLFRRPNIFIEWYRKNYRGGKNGEKIITIEDLVKIKKMVQNFEFI